MISVDDAKRYRSHMDKAMTSIRVGLTLAEDGAPVEATFALDAAKCHLAKAHEVRSTAFGESPTPQSRARGRVRLKPQ